MKELTSKSRFAKEFVVNSESPEARASRQPIKPGVKGINGNTVVACKKGIMAATPRICLNMIVKNESAIIERCLGSVWPVIDHVVICDTGSTDTTTDTIGDFFGRHGLPGEIHRIHFENFEASRNRALDLCRQSSADFDYILLTDADMELFVVDPTFKGRLTGAVYKVRQTNAISYYNTRLLKRDCPARYVGVTHEFLACDSQPTRLEGLWFYDHACGSNRAEKFERDIRLLTSGLEREPENARYMFYLAQSYKDCGQIQNAIDWYRKRIDAGGWEEETWYSLYMTARCYARLGDVNRFVEYCLKAYDYRPCRAEPLYCLAQHYRQAGRPETAMLFAEAARSIPYPRGDSLFIEDSVYYAGIPQELSIAGFYCTDEGKRTTGYESCLALATSREAGAQARAAALGSLCLYARRAAEVFGNCPIQGIDFACRDGLVGTNPTIWTDGGGIFGVLRAVNYFIDDTGYHAQDPDGIFRTRNFFLTFDSDFRVRQWTEMKEQVAGPPTFPCNVHGFEDCRLFFWREQFWSTCTVRNRNPHGRCEVALLRLDDQRNIADVQILNGVHPEMHQKNWAPLVDDDELFLLYSTDPTIVLRYDLDDRQTHLYQVHHPKPCLKSFRGGSQAVSLPEGWIHLIHETHPLDDRRRVYLHRFVLLTKDFKVQAFTEPFYFAEKGVEFCAGLAYDRQRRRLIASFGVNDEDARLAFFDADAVLSRLEL